jgi:DNA invertase Pin-like site-specific DNA recombinase
MSQIESSTPSPENTLHIYIRVSTVVQRDEGTSLATQLELGQKRAQALGFFTQVWDEGGKSSSHEEVSSRPRLAALYKSIQDGLVKHLYVYDQSRLSRSDGVASAFRYMCNKRGVRLYTKDGEFDLANSTDRFLTQILDAMAEFENSARMDRALTGRFARAREGLWFGGKSPFGYHVVNKKLQINSQEARWVRYIFRARADGLPISAIKRQLDKHQVRPRHAKHFSMRSLVVILRNPRYKGASILKDSRSGSVMTLKSPVIIEPDLWGKAQHELDEKLRKSVIGQVRKKSSLLCDLAYCGHCGRGISVRISEATNTQFYHCAFRDRLWSKHGKSLFYRVRQKSCGFDRATPALHIDEAVLAVVQQAFESSTPYLRFLEDQISGGENILFDSRYRASLHDQVSSLEAEREALASKNLDHRYWVGTKRRRTPVVRPNEVADRYIWVCRRLAELQKRLLKSDELVEFKQWFDATREKFKRYEGLDIEGKKDLLGEIVTGVEIRYVAEVNAHSLTITFRKKPMGAVDLSLPPLRRDRYVWHRSWWALVKKPLKKSQRLSRSSGIS